MHVMAKEYLLRDGKLKLKSGKTYKNVLFIECNETEFSFLDKNIKIQKVIPTDIEEFKRTPLSDITKESDLLNN